VKLSASEGGLGTTINTAIQNPPNPRGDYWHGLPSVPTHNPLALSDANALAIPAAHATGHDQMVWVEIETVVREFANMMNMQLQQKAAETLQLMQSSYAIAASSASHSRNKFLQKSKVKGPGKPSGKEKEKHIFVKVIMVAVAAHIQ
jgi:hypothetical protein